MRTPRRSAAFDVSSSTWSQSNAGTRVNRTERLTVVLIFMALPFEQILPRIGPLSSAWILYAIVAIGLLFFRTAQLARALCHPIMAMGALFLLLAVFFESLQPSPSYSIILSTAEMFAGAAIVAALCRDRSALVAGFAGFVLADVVASFVVIHLGSQELHAQATNFESASVAREQAFPSGLALGSNINQLAFLLGEGAVVALMLGIVARRPVPRLIAMAASLLCFAATVLTLSRGGIFVAVLGYCFALIAFARRKLRQMVLLAALALLCAALVPGVVAARLNVSLQPNTTGKLDSRAVLFDATLHNVGEYFLLGVGSGNFYSSWAAENGFQDPGRFTVEGPHNSYIAAVIYWGIFPGLALLALLVVVARRAPPARGDPLATTICAIGIMSAAQLAFDHDFYIKALSVAIGLFIASDCWLWAGRSARTYPLRKASRAISYSQNYFASRSASRLD